MGKNKENVLVDDVKNDTISKNFWRDNEHFADLFNAVLFGGEEIVKPENLEEMDTDISGVIMADEYKISLGRFRDVVKKDYNGVELVVLGLELQEHIHYGMPLRTMIYDSLGYLKEFDGVRKWNKDNGVKAVNADEFLSGIKKEDRFKPLFADYNINLVQVLDSGKLLFHNDDVRILFDVVSNIYKNNIEYIYSKYDGAELDSELFWMIGKITSNENMLEISREKKGEPVIMCEAWKRYYEAARQDGRKSATIDGIIFMIKYGISKNDLLKKYSEEDYNEALSRIENK